MPDSVEKKPEHEASSRLVTAKRVYWSSGLLFGLLMLMVLSGLSSITLLYDGIPSAEDIQGTEGAVLDIVRTLKPAIRFIHEYGGYLAMFLSGWLVVELVRFGRNARAHGGTSTEKSSGPLIVCLQLLVGTGIEAREYMDKEPTTNTFNLPAAAKLEEFAKAQEESIVESHTGMLTYVLAGVVVVLVLSVQLTHRLAVSRKEDEDTDDEKKSA
ncbi:MAG: hypothetical protein ACYTDT_09845 [Planctomycetota bacterium]|jgi:hypothetical protein